MIFGIKLRELEQGELPFPREIAFIGNELFTNEGGLRKRELGVKTLTAIGNLSNGIDIWNEIGNSEVLYYIDNSANEFNEYFRIDGSFIKRNVGLIMEDLGEYVLIHPNQENYIKRDGSIKIDNSYSPTNPKGILSKKFVDNLGSVDISQPIMNVSYQTTENFQPHIKGDDEIFLRLPEEDPFILDVLWNDQGNIRRSAGHIAHIRYFTNYDISFNTGIKSPTNGYIDIIGNDTIYPNSSTRSRHITKIEVLEYGERTSWFRIAYNCSNLTEFIISATGQNKVSNFYNAWLGCKKLTSFPLLDTSNVTNFYQAWNGCESLTSFPSLDTSSGTNFIYTWAGCKKLTSFPLLDVSSGIDFRSSWQNCNLLASFPLLDVSSGTNFTHTWAYCPSLASFPLLDVSNGTNFNSTWIGCKKLTSFPEIDTSSGTNFNGAWHFCESLTSFPLLDVSNGTDFRSVWEFCESLTSFPLIDTSGGTNFSEAWRGCESLTSFPLIDTSNGTDFSSAWVDCSSLTSFPLLDVSNGWNFSSSWRDCSSLPSCPGTDGTVTIPTGASTHGMCEGI